MKYENMTRRRVLCFGDSNTYGYDPARDGRYGDDERTRWCCRTCWATAGAWSRGLPGRTAVFDDPITEGMNGLRVITPILMSHAPLDTVTIMLGTNDSKGAVRLQFPSDLWASFGSSRRPLHRMLARQRQAGRARHRSAVHHAGVRPPDFKDAMGTGCHERCAGISAQLEPMLKDIANVRFLTPTRCPARAARPLTACT